MTVRYTSAWAGVAGMTFTNKPLSQNSDSTHYIKLHELLVFVFSKSAIL
jgi:hypothetical protein